MTYRWLAVWGAGAWCLALFVTLAIVVGTREAPPPLDADVLRFALDYREDSSATFFRAITVLGSVAVLGPILVAVAAWLWVRGRPVREAAFLLAALAGANVLQHLGKAVVERPRPAAVLHLVDAGPFGYPSGHAAQALAAWIALAVVATSGRSRLGIAGVWVATATIALGVGTSRVVLGVHWASDVVGGFAIAGAWLCVLAAVLLATRPERSVDAAGGGERGAERARATP